MQQIEYAMFHGPVYANRALDSCLSLYSELLTNLNQTQISLAEAREGGAAEVNQMQRLGE
jgi:hypothetical protein